MWWAEPHATTLVEREYLLAMAETASRALERAKLREAERRERARVETLSELTRLLAAALTPEAIGDVVIGHVRAALGGADALSLGVISQDHQQLEWVTAAGYPDEIREWSSRMPLSVPTAATDAARTGQPVVIRTPGEYEQRYRSLHTPAIIAQASSWLAWPLRIGTTTVGALSVAWKSPQPFEPGQLAFIAAVADFLAQALVRARVYADEHAIATVLQRAVMPKTAAVVPGLDIGTSYRQAGPAKVIGGDWYDVLALPAGRAYLAVGDVVGHGIAAAEDMTQLRNAGRALAIEGHQPAGLLRELADPPSHRHLTVVRPDVAGQLGPGQQPVRGLVERVDDPDRAVARAERGLKHVGPRQVPPLRLVRHGRLQGEAAAVPRVEHRREHRR